MNNNTETQRRAREHKRVIERNRKDKNGGYFLNLSTVVFTTMVIGPFVKDGFDLDEAWPYALGGLIGTALLYNIANRFLK